MTAIEFVALSAATTAVGWLVWSVVGWALGTLWLGLAAAYRLARGDAEESSC